MSSNFAGFIALILKSFFAKMSARLLDFVAPMKARIVDFMRPYVSDCTRRNMDQEGASTEAILYGPRIRQVN
jgi:hypothetical protein